MSEWVSVTGATLADCPGQGNCNFYWFFHWHTEHAVILFYRDAEPLVNGDTITWTA